MNKNFMSIGGALLVVLLLALCCVDVFTIKTGKVGVVRSFGKVQAVDLQAGINWSIPLYQDVQIIDTKERLVKIPTKTLSKDGMPFAITVAVRYKVGHGKANHVVSNLHTSVAELVTEYTDSAIDDVSTGFSSETLYTADGRVALLAETVARLKSKTSMYVDIIDVLITLVDPPETLRLAIEKRQAATMDARTNEVLSTTLTPALLQLKAIEKFNPQASVIYMGTNGVSPVMNVGAGK